MLMFNEAVFDRMVHGTGGVYSDVTTWELLGSADELRVEVRTDQASGATLSLTVTLQDSGDGINWNDKNTLLQKTLQAGTNEVFFASDDGSTPSGKYVRFEVTVQGDEAHVFIIATGRSE